MTAEVVNFMQQRSAAWSWRINDDEDAALEYLPHSDQVLYIRGLRRYMDYASGVVGIRRRVSYQMLIELLEVRRDWGSNRPNERLSREALRQCLKRLERRGLLERMTNDGKAVSLVFKLPLADTDVIPLKKEQQGNNTPSTTHLRLVRYIKIYLSINLCRGQSKHPLRASLLPAHSKRFSRKTRMRSLPSDLAGRCCGALPRICSWRSGWLARFRSSRRMIKNRI